MFSWCGAKRDIMRSLNLNTNSGESSSAKNTLLKSQPQGEKQKILKL